MKKAISRKTVYDIIWADEDWNVVTGKLTPTPGRPPKVKHLFKVIAEKIPLRALDRVEKALAKAQIKAEGVYMAHDSMGVARYGGRGQIFSRLRNHRTKYAKQLLYFSFYIIENKNHERELENAILRAAGAQMTLNQRKKRDGIEPGNVADYEAGAYFFERQGRRGKRRKAKRGRQIKTSQAR